MKKFFIMEHDYKNEYENMQISLICKSFINKKEFRILEDILEQFIGNLETFKDLYRIVLLIRKVFSSLEEYELRIQMESKVVSYTIEYKERRICFFFYSYVGEEDEHTTTYSHSGILNTTFSVKHIAKGYMLDDLFKNYIQVLLQEIKKIYFLKRLSTFNLDNISFEQLLTEENLSYFVRKRSL